MKTAFQTFRLLALLAFVAMFATAANSAIEVARDHTATGALGCSVSGATVATPSVLTCSAAHHLIDGDQVQITGIGGTTTDNTTCYVKATSSTTVTLYSDSALSTGVTGTGSYTSGGTVTKAHDISSNSGDFTIRVRIHGLTAAKNAVVCLQDTVDGYVSDTVTLACINVSGPIGPAPAAGQEFTWRKYQLPSLRAGTTSARLRINVTQIDSATTVTTSLFFEQ